MHPCPRADADETSAARHLLLNTRGAHYVEYLILVGVVALLSIPAFVSAGAEMNGNIRALGGDASLMGF
jgi:hypothetical protein